MPLELQRLVEAATELDAIQARARFSQLIGGTEPVLAADSALEVRSARHPLLIQAVAARLEDEDASPRHAGAPFADQQTAEEPGDDGPPRRRGRLTAEGRRPGAPPGRLSRSR